MTVVVMPDAIKLARAVLLASTDITNILSQRVETVSPNDTSTPWIRLHRVGGPRSASAPMRLATAYVQVDCFVPPRTAGSSASFSGDSGAMKLALLAEATLFDAANFSNTEGTICHVAETLGPQSAPDTSRTPPTPRVMYTLALTIRPN